jgi:crotonobetainyl-CoA:carnitine CoA-transferase CaiB-like acyl-CoA transferase
VLHIQQQNLRKNLVFHSLSMLRMNRIRSHLTSGEDNSKLLQGIRVVELATVIAAPACTALLADLGADVIKIERPGGDTWRSAQSMFEQDNRGKRSVCIDLTKLEGVQLFSKLVDGADVFVTNIRSAGLKKLGYVPSYLL